MSHDLLINTANTLSVNSSPGEHKRFPNVSQESIFSFGDFKIHRDLTPNSLSAETAGYSFGNFSSLSSLSAASTTFDAHRVINIQENELNVDKDNPQSYAYFSSFYTKVASSLNNIINTFPYAILAFDNNTGTSIVNYVNNYNQTSSFSIPVSALTNQGYVVYASGYTRTNSASTDINLFTDYTQFEIELSSTTLHQTTYEIRNYSYDYTNGKLNFDINGYLFSASTTASTSPLYIRPSLRRYYAFKNSLPDLDYQLLFEQQFLMPNPQTDTFERRSFIWPTVIDGFNPDTQGTAYDNYIASILSGASMVDSIKTNWMVRTMIPENYLELDSDGMIYRKMVDVYADEFDKIKKYVDNLAYSHSVNYQNEETIPDKFLYRLSRLLGWEPINEFSDSDIFDYLASEDSSGYTHQMYNQDLWKRILISINWLYKKKGTRDSLQFIFKLMGAPDCLIHFNEFVYKINQSYSGVTSGNNFSDKVRDTTGFINYDASKYVFQEGGPDRGDGNKYINQWMPEFNPIRTVDNRKVYTGDSTVFGTENVVNTKEVEIEISPAAAIECDVQEWFDLGFSTGNTITTGQFSHINNGAVDLAVPTTISAMTMNQWLDYVYTNGIDPRNHKVIGHAEGHHSYFYPVLRQVYLTYFYWNLPSQLSNQLTFQRLDRFIDIIHRHFYDYVLRLIPATTIIDRAGVTYRNTIFNRQKFVYPPGINAGSEFQTNIPVDTNLTINTTNVIASVNDVFQSDINSVNVVATVANAYNQTINSVQITNQFSVGYTANVNAVNTSLSFNLTQIQNTFASNRLSGYTINFPTQMVPQPNIPVSARTFRTRTATQLAEDNNIS